MSLAGATSRSVAISRPRNTSLSPEYHPVGEKYDTTYIRSASMRTGESKSARCQPEADSSPNVTDASS